MDILDFAYSGEIWGHDHARDPLLSTIAGSEFSLTYKFGNQKIKSQKRKGGLQDEL